MARRNHRQPSPHTSRATRAFVMLSLVPVLFWWSCTPESALAHTSATVAPDDLMRFWSPDPLVVIGALVAGWFYARGCGNLREIGKRTGRGPIISNGRIAAFWAGLATMLIALASPLDTATATVFTAHMIQHILLIAVGPPLILLGSPMTVILNGVPRSWRRPIARTSNVRVISGTLAILTIPVIAWCLHALTLWVWHDPTLYQAAVRHEWLHLVEHVSFVATAFLYWWTIIPASNRAHNNVGPGFGILSVFAMGMQGAALGAILTFWGSMIYPVYSGRSELWGISALSDQRLAGLIMWIPAGSIYVAAALMLLGQWFHIEGDGNAPEGVVADSIATAVTSTATGEVSTTNLETRYQTDTASGWTACIDQRTKGRCAALRHRVDMESTPTGLVPGFRMSVSHLGDQFPGEDTTTTICSIWAFAGVIAGAEGDE